MKKYKFSKRQNQVVNEQQNLWDAFLTHIDNIYYPGCTEKMDDKLLKFEYESFKNCYQ